MLKLANSFLIYKIKSMKLLYINFLNKFKDLLSH